MKLRKADFAFILSFLLLGAFVWRLEHQRPMPVSVITSEHSSGSGGLKIYGPSATQTFMLGKEVRLQFVADNGVPPLHWFVSSGVLPPGLRLDEQTGLVYGAPTQMGNFRFIIGVTDSAGKTAIAQ